MPNNPPLASVRAREALLPCPFCGGGAHIRSWDWPYPRFQIRCGNCRATPHGRANSEAKAIAAWNTRLAIDTATTQLLDEIEERVKGLQRDVTPETPFPAKGVELVRNAALNEALAAIQELRHG